MSDPVLGYATLPIIPSMRGVESMMDRQLASMMPNIGSRAGAQFGSGFGRAAQQAVQITADATAATFTGVVAAGTAALVKGYSRLTTIQDADKALEISLGSSAEAAALLEDTLDTVRGTPFNLDQFAAGAQQLAGMNVEAEKVPHYLEAIGETAATQGKRAGEYADRLIDTFGKVTAAGQLDLESVWQISETGVSALAILANAYGVTRDEMKDMISSGAIPAEEALDHLADGILNGSDGPAGATLALAGTMEALRNNMSGAVAGISPALARLGAAVIEPFSPAVVAGANSLVDIIDDLGEEAGDLAQQVAGSAGFDEFMDFLENAPARAKSLVHELAPAAPVLAGLGSALGAMGSGSLPLIGKYLPVVNPLLAGVVGLVLAVPGARSELTDLAADILPVVREIGDDLLPVIEDLSDVAGDVLPPALGLAGDALILTLEAAMPLVRVVGDLTGFLADHEGVVVGVAAAYAGWKIAERLGAASEAFDTFAVKAYDAVGSSALVQNLELIGSGARDVATNLLTVPDASDRMASQVAGGTAKMREGFSGLLSGVGALTIGLTAASFAVGAIFQGVSQAHAEASSAMADMKPRNFDDRSLADLDQYAKSLDLAAAAAEKADDAEGGFLGTLRGTAELLSPMENKILDNAVAAGDFGKAYRIAADAAEEMWAKYERVGRNVGDGVGLSLAEVERWVTELDLDPAVMTATEMIDAMEAAVSPKAELMGLELDEALSIDPDVLEANAKLIEDSMSSTSDAFASFGDILQLTDDPLDPKAAADARKAVADAEERLGEARAEAADLASDATDRQRTDAVNRIADAREDLDDARQSLSDLLATDSPLDRNKIARFYEDVIADTEAFSGNIQKAISMGYDPAYVGRLLQAGPEQAGPVLEQLVGATTQSFIDMVNSAEDELSSLSTQATEMARLTQIAVNDSTEEGQQKVRDLDTAIAISLALMNQKGASSIETIASAAGTTVEEVKRVAGEFNLALNGIDGRQLSVSLHVRGLAELVELVGSLGVLDANGDPVRPGAYNADRRDRRPNRTGNVYEYAQGGFGVTPSHVLGAGEAIYKYREPATGGEAFFPRFGNTDLSEKNMAVVAAWYGGRYVTSKQIARWASMPVPSFSDIDRPAAPEPTGRRPRRLPRRGGDVHVTAQGASATEVSDEILWGQR